jgi:hypothetical protein
MCQPDDEPPTSFEAFVADPLIALVMASDGLSVEDMREVLRTARAALCARAADEPKPPPRLTLVG